MSVLNQGQAFTRVMLGTRVDRATDTLPQSGDEALFAITGGRVLLTLIVGEVTTVMGATANNTKLKFNPSATGSDVDLCAVLATEDDAVGTLYSITGDFSDALKDGVLALETDALPERPIVLSEGAIELDCAANNTGSVAWSLWYVPLDDGASIAAA